MVQPMVIVFVVVIAVLTFFMSRKNYDKLSNKKENRQASKTFTKKEVAAHTTEDDLWLIIKGKVYNFTDYIGLHPGGEAILRNAGKDSTEGFSGSQHPARVWDMIDDFYIGELDGGETENNVYKED